VNHPLLSLKVATRFLRRADQVPGARKDTRDLVFPINSQKGISKSVVKNNAKSESGREDQIKPDSKDIRPSDVFNANANNVMMLNYVVNGYRDMEKAIHNQIPKDKGYDTVKNLSQYLIETGGGGGTKPVSR
jgi:hypothetical protein